MFANADNAPGEAGMEIVANNLPFYDEEANHEDVADLFFDEENAEAEDEVHDEAEAPRHGGYIKTRNIILFLTAICLISATGVSVSAAMTNTNSNVDVVRSFNRSGAKTSKKADRPPPQRTKQSKKADKTPAPSNRAPSVSPSASPSASPSFPPTASPSFPPTVTPSVSPSGAPTEAGGCDPARQRLLQRLQRFLNLRQIDC